MIVVEKTKQNAYGFSEGDGYFDELPQSTQDIIYAAIEDTFNTVNQEFLVEREIEEVECRSRSGFIPYSHNKGGLEKNAYTDLYNINCTGRYTGNKKVSALVEKYINDSLSDIAKDFFEENRDILCGAGIDSPEKVHYHNLYDAKLGGLAEELSNRECDTLSGDYSSVQYQIRIMYHGKQDKKHNLTVFASISASDAPYHRSSDSLGEVSISWVTDAGLKRKLAKALKTAISEAF